MENKLTLEQAIKNIEVVITQFFSGTRNEHIALDQSLNMIKSELEKINAPCENKSCPKNISEDIKVGC